MANHIIINNKIKNFKKKIKVSSDKSISIRSILLASQAVGVSKISNLLESEDVLNTLKTIRKLGINDNVTFTDSRNDINNIYKISDITFNLSIQPEPFGRTTIEAISCGSKFIGWDHGGTKEILEELYPDGLVKLGDIDSLKEKVIEISDKNYFLPKENIFTLKKMIDETIQLYGQLVDKDL